MREQRDIYIIMNGQDEILFISLLLDAAIAAYEKLINESYKGGLYVFHYKTNVIGCEEDILDIHLEKNDENGKPQVILST